MLIFACYSPFWIELSAEVNKCECCIWAKQVTSQNTLFDKYCIWVFVKHCCRGTTRWAKTSWRATTLLLCAANQPSLRQTPQVGPHRDWSLARTRTRRRRRPRWAAMSSVSTLCPSPTSTQAQREPVNWRTQPRRAPQGTGLSKQHRDALFCPVASVPFLSFNMWYFKSN